MRFLLIVLALCCAGVAQGQVQGVVPRPGAAPGAAPARQAAPRVALVDRIVAVVGREVVTLSELSERRDFGERQLRRQGTPLPERSQLERQILERLIIEKAQLQLARENGIRVEESQLDRALERVAENNSMSLSAFRQALEKDGVPFERFRDEVRQQIQMQRLREREVDDRIEVSDAEIDQFLAEAKSAGGKSWSAPAKLSRRTTGAGGWPTCASASSPAGPISPNWRVSIPPMAAPRAAATSTGCCPAIRCPSSSAS